MGVALHRQVIRVLAYQATLALATATVAFTISGVDAAKSALAGGVVAFLSTLVYVVTALTGDSESPRHVLRAHARGEAYKLIANVVLFVLLFTTAASLVVPMVILGFFVALSGYWLALLRE